MATMEAEAVTAAIRAQFRLLKGEGELSPKRLVAVGRDGPAFGARGEVVYVVGLAGLSMPPRDLIDVGAKYDSEVKGRALAMLQRTEDFLRAIVAMKQSPDSEVKP